MKHYEFKYSNYEKMKSFVHSKNIHDNCNILIQVFTGIIEYNFINKLLSEIQYLLPKANIVGATTAGEIYKDKVLSYTTIISFTIFEETQIKTKLSISNNNEYTLGVSIAEELVENDTKLIILFVDGLLTDSGNVVKGIKSVNSDIIICGGKAGDNGYLKKTFVFTKEGITQNGIAAVSLTGKQLNVTTEYNFGWSGIGKLMTVTKASGNRIFTIDNINAVDIYKKYLGREAAEKLPMSATEFPFIIIKDGNEIARTISGCYEDGSLSFLGNVETNDKIRFGYGNVNMLAEKSIEIANRLKSENIDIAFIYSCSVRRAFMQDKIKLDIYPISKAAQIFGFFTYGEFFTFNSSTQLMNVTMAVLGISEGRHVHSNEKIVLDEDKSSVNNFIAGKDFGVVKVLTNLVNEVTKELEQVNVRLEEQNHKIEQINNITKAIMKINSEIISSGEFYTLLQMILDKALKIISKGKMASILLIEDNVLYYRATAGYIKDKIKNRKYRLEDTYYYGIYTSNDVYSAMIIKDLKEHLFNTQEEYDSWKDMLPEQPKEILTCSIGIDGRIIGFINIFNTINEGDFNEDDKNLVENLCYDIGIVLKNTKLLENILYMSRYDNLTGACNRHYLIEVLNKTISVAQSSNGSFVICVLDLNGLKCINDMHGHEAGDKFIVRFVNTFNNEIDENDVLARTGGDEFTILFNNKNAVEVINLINKVSEIFENNPFIFENDVKKICFAYGISVFREDSEHIDQLLKIADQRMYENKRKMKENQK